MSDSSGEWQVRLRRLLRQQHDTDADNARKAQEHQATADAWARTVLRPTFATLAQVFAQDGGPRRLSVIPDIPDVNSSRVGVEVIHGHRTEFAYVLTMTADHHGIAVTRSVTDADAEPSETTMVMKEEFLSPDISPQHLTTANTEVLITDFLREYARFYTLSEP